MNETEETLDALWRIVQKIRSGQAPPAKGNPKMNDTIFAILLHEAGDDEVVFKRAVRTNRPLLSWVGRVGEEQVAYAVWLNRPRARVLV